VAFCQGRAEKAGIRIDVDCDPDLQASVDASLIEQAIVNLLDNAIKYTGENGLVQVEAAAEPRESLIRVRDNGIGIARQHLPRLFERFYRVDKARSRKLGGTGLGLSIVKHIVQAHGGSVKAESTPNRGSTFEIHLPR
jgi:two-component system phosphate regulon sensor histidine kinase PhoR